MDWLIQNKEWLFNSAGVAIPLAIVGWLFVKYRRKIVQKQRSGDRSTNIQIGGDVKITRHMRDKDD